VTVFWIWISSRKISTFWATNPWLWKYCDLRKMLWPENRLLLKQNTKHWFNS